MEVFVAFSKDEQIPILQQTMEAWAECELVEPVGIRASEGKYELMRRITADNMAEGNYYILADLGCVPDDKFSVPALMKRLAISGDGLIGFSKEGRDLAYPTGVRICQKGVVARWVPKSTESYDQEHAEAIRLAGKRVTIWENVKYKHLLEC